MRIFALLWLSLIFAHAQNGSVGSPGISKEEDIAIRALREPPEKITTGPETENISIGIWSEKPSYSQSELKNVWVVLYAKQVKKQFYKNSRFEVYEGERKVLEFPIEEPIDGPPETSWSGGLSHQLRDLKEGTYVLVWKTDTHTSNRVTVTITP